MGIEQAMQGSRGKVPVPKNYAILTREAIAQRGRTYREIAQEIERTKRQAVKVKTIKAIQPTFPEAITPGAPAIKQRSKQLKVEEAKLKKSIQTLVPTISQILRKGQEGERSLVTVRRNIAGIDYQKQQDVIQELFNYTTRDIATVGQERGHMIEMAGSSPSFNLDLSGIGGFSLPGFDLPGIDWEAIKKYGIIVFAGLMAILVVPRLIGGK